MSRTIAAGIILLTLLAVPDVALAAGPTCQPPVVGAHSFTPEEHFEVSFRGIVAFFNPISGMNYWKAVAVSSEFSFRHPLESLRTMGMPHIPELRVGDDVELQTLEDAAGHKAEKISLGYSVPLTGLAVRVRAYRAPYTCPVDSGVNFNLQDDSLPHLTRVEGIRAVPFPAILDNSVTLPEVGTFEVEGGDSITTTDFTDTGAFYSQDGLTQLGYYGSDGVASKKCRKFADVVKWEGRTLGRAMLEISRNGAGPGAVWRQVRFKTLAALKVWIVNMSADGSLPTSEHFSLFNRLMTEDNLPIICPCDVQGTPPPQCTLNIQRQNRAAGMSSRMRSSVPAFDTVVGCSASGWP